MIDIKAYFNQLINSYDVPSYDRKLGYLQGIEETLRVIRDINTDNDICIYDEQLREALEEVKKEIKNL